MNKNSILSLHKLLLPLAATGFATSGSAQVSWVNPDGGAFHEVQNWDGEAVPAEEDVAEFSVDAAYEVQFTEDATIGEFVNRAGDIAFELGGNTLKVEGRMDFDAAGSAGETIFRNGTISSGSQVSFGGEGDGGAARSVVLEGVDSFWEMTSMLRIGSSSPLGDSELNVGTSSLVLGQEAGASKNSLLLAGSGSKMVDP